MINKLSIIYANLTVLFCAPDNSTYLRDEGPPVQGPINREPDDKLYPNSRPNLGVKKFFESLLSKLSR